PPPRPGDTTGQDGPGPGRRSGASLDHRRLDALAERRAEGAAYGDDIADEIAELAEIGAAETPSGNLTAAHADPVGRARAAQAATLAITPELWVRPDA
ncbi:hypothetical protein AAHZ94_35230, partial [Streptomyces sp. HSW2009]|uniref:hypothetical protein n=1 Tax=Streptomyces sp. HSW2009 TaxID=3142890 RepID=UPI0032EE3FDD